MPRSYTATALIMIDPARPHILEGDAGGGQLGAGRVETEVEILRSDAILVAAASSGLLGDTLRTDAEFSPRSWLASLGLSTDATELDPEARLIARLRQTVRMARRGQSDIVGIEATAHSPGAAADLANALADVYLANQAQAKARQASTVVALLDAQLDVEISALAEREGEIDAYIREQAAWLAGERGDTRLSAQLRDLETQRSQRQALSATIERVTRDTRLRRWQLVADELGSDSLRQLYADWQIASDNIGAPAPAPGLDLASIETSLRSRTEQELADLNLELSQRHGQETMLLEGLHRTVLDSELPTDASAQLYRMIDRARQASQGYQTLVKRRTELEQQAALQLADSRIVSRAYPPTVPSSLSPALLLSTAFCGGLFAAGLVTLARESLAATICSPSQALALGVPNLGTIPFAKSKRDGREGASSVADLVLSDPGSAFAQKVARLQLGLERERRPDEALVVMVSSVQPGEGKTTLALAIARSAALSGQKVLLLDCDLNRPGLDQHVSFEMTAGLGDLLAAGDRIDPSELLVREPESGVTVMLAGRAQGPFQGTPFAQPAFAGLLTSARAQFDLVILDSPPAAALVDGIQLARAADTVVLVLKWAMTSLRDIEQTLAEMNQDTPHYQKVFTVINKCALGAKSY